MKEMFYFNDALNTFMVIWCQTYANMVKDHLDSKRGNPLPPLYGLLFLISSMGSFRCIISHDTFHSLCYTSCGTLVGTFNKEADEL